jgi:hypothetical protein
VFFDGAGDSAVPHAAIQANSRSGRGVVVGVRVGLDELEASGVEEGDEVDGEDGLDGLGGSWEWRKYVYSVTGEINRPVPWMRYCARDFIAVR